MLSWWRTDSYFNNEQIKMDDIEIINLHMVHQDYLDQG